MHTLKTGDWCEICQLCTLAVIAQFLSCRPGGLCTCFCSSAQKQRLVLDTVVHDSALQQPAANLNTIQLSPLTFTPTCSFDVRRSSSRVSSLVSHVLRVQVLLFIFNLFVSYGVSFSPFFPPWLALDFALKYCQKKCPHAFLMCLHSEPHIFTLNLSKHFCAWCLFVRRKSSSQFCQTLPPIDHRDSCWCD